MIVITELTTKFIRKLLETSTLSEGAEVAVKEDTPQEEKKKILDDCDNCTDCKLTRKALGTSWS
jgi:hypothetical protein